MWAHRKLIVYGKALDAAAEMDGIARGARPDLGDQLRRASASVLLNLAEGACEFRPAEKVRFYRMARRSAAECAAILDLMDRLQQAKSPAHERIQGALDEIAAMLAGMIRRVDDA